MEIRAVRRFIPARAGNTARALRRACSRPVHPRAGGEHAVSNFSASRIPGSSPRGRGTRAGPARRDARHRFIPARAGNTCGPSRRSGTPAVHPRAGGEHQWPEAGDSRWTGSSPRGRGTPQVTPERCLERRFIPARAGNTCPRSATSTSGPVHPRAGGEHHAAADARILVSGSSPRGRGTQKRGRAFYARVRFIPARAGNTKAASPGSAPRSVHPRAGGEHAWRQRGSSMVSGSSPRGRGTRRALAPHPVGPRFIPARAGNTPAAWSGVSRASVHPRAGGEHGIYSPPRRLTAGSSPRGRGTRGRERRAPAPARFIPARAGNTASAGTSASPRTVHPRAGGEHEDDARDVDRQVGSSPRGRGTPRGCGERREPGRFIPARAGNTSRPTRPLPRPPVHPRAGGEHANCAGVSKSTTGSSPRGRGTHRGQRQNVDTDRFIPARAGNTLAESAKLRTRSVHPRAGGEHLRRPRTYRAVPGSSPRGRGTRHAAVCVGSSCRFIPARAGNTHASVAAVIPNPVHPRAGGEHLVSEALGFAFYGSSPRGRGTLRRARLLDALRRFIPARAGNTPGRANRSGSGSVHPRAGGEHTTAAGSTACGVGSSPRGRGTPAKE